YTVGDGDGQTTTAPQAGVDVGGHQDLPCSAAHPFYTRLNEILDKADFDGYCRVALSTILCRRDWASGSATGALLPHAAARVLRGTRLGARDRVARSRFVERAELSWARAARGAAGSFDGLSDTPTDRR